MFEVHRYLKDQKFLFLLLRGWRSENFILSATAKRIKRCLEVASIDEEQPTKYIVRLELQIGFNVFFYQS